ncbi:MAG: extracellular solute-binding protein [Eubacteriales bacterium]
MKKRVLSVLMSVVLAATAMVGCGSTDSASSTDTATETADVAEATEEVSSEDVIELEYWTWFPTEAQLEETIAAFEAENPNIKINMTVMESGTYRDKVVLALSTGEEIDVIGVQPSAFAASVEDYLVDLEEYMPTVLGDDWMGSYSQDMFDKGKDLTSGDAKFITILNSGSMFGFYNATLLEEIGCEVPTTIEEYKEVAEALYEVYPDKLAGVFAGMEGWVIDEMLLTVLTQGGDYYNEVVYNGATMDSPEYVEAFRAFKQFFDDGIFSMDVMDLDYGSATEVFTNGDALVYYMGSWDATLISSVLREQNGVGLEEVGIMALPVAYEGGELAVRAYLDCGLGIIEESEHKEAAAKFVQYLSSGDGVEILAKQFAGTPGISDFEMDASMLTSDIAVESWDTLLELMNAAPADRNNLSAFAGAVEGPMVQSVINGSVTPEEAAAGLQSGWDNGDY